MVGERGSEERRKVGLSIVIHSLCEGVIAASSCGCVGSLGYCIVEIEGNFHFAGTILIIRYPYTQQVRALASGFIF